MCKADILFSAKRYEDAFQAYKAVVDKAASGAPEATEERRDAGREPLDSPSASKDTGRISLPLPPTPGRLSRRERKSFQVKSLLGMGKTRLNQNKPDVAGRYFEEACLADPKNREAQFYRAGFEKISTGDFIKDVTASTRYKPEDLVLWAQLYQSYGLNKEAIACYEAATRKDPRYYPAQLGLAEILAVDHQYESSIQLFKTLASDFPDVSKCLILWARALGWSKRYRESMDLYEYIHRLNPNDPVVPKEKARVAMWGKMADDAKKTYTAMVTPPVDQELILAVTPIVIRINNPSLTDALKLLTDTAEKGSVYQGYEKFEERLERCKQGIPSDQKMQIESAVVNLLPAYRIQKAAYLESRAKLLAWNKRFSRALNLYEELIDFAPGNEEAIFDYAQVECTLGLCDDAIRTYEKLLSLDPLHSLAGMPLEQEKIRQHPSLQIGHSYWLEEGRGELSQIVRNRTDLTLDVPITSNRYHLSLTERYWIEHPGFTRNSVAANGASLGFSWLLNPYVSGSSEFTYKNYTDDEFDATYTGHAYLWLNPRDYARIGAGYDRADELYNYFGIRQGAQSDSGWFAVESNVTRNLEMKGKAGYFDYNDGNAVELLTLSSGYAFTDHPRIFKATLAGEYRDARKNNVFEYQGNELVDIVHPYWTPDNYKAGWITLEWYHDISKYFISGNQLHFYDIRVTPGTNSELIDSPETNVRSNVSLQIEGEWHYEFYKHWTIGAKGLIYRSQVWDADAVWGMVQYQF